MSLVGTRPPTVDEWDKYELHHRARLATKPGLTGMWQVSGRSNITDFEEVVKLDKGYRHYFYGSTEETLKLLEEKLQANYPGIQIAGKHYPLLLYVLDYFHCYLEYFLFLMYLQEKRQLHEYMLWKE